MTISLPTAPIKALTKSPKKLIIYSKPKVGKTSALAKLENALILDLESGSDFVDALKIKANKVSEIFSICDAIIAANKPYKYLVVDTLTKLEDLALPYALYLYKQTPMGKNFTGDNVLHLPNGNGYQWLREAMNRICQRIEECADRIIYLGHIKTKFIEKEGKEVSSSDLDLTGKIKSSMSADADAIGFLYRKTNNQNVLTFKTTDEVICGARPPHLKNQEIVLSEEKDGNLITHWDKIYID